MRKDVIEEKLNKRIEESVDISFDYGDVKKAVDFDAFVRPKEKKARKALPFAVIGALGAVAVALVIIPAAVIVAGVGGMLYQSGTGAAYDMAEGTDIFDAERNEQAAFPNEAINVGQDMDGGAAYSARVEGNIVIVAEKYVFVADGISYRIADDAECFDAYGERIAVFDLSSGDGVTAALGLDGSGETVVREIKKIGDRQ